MSMSKRMEHPPDRGHLLTEQRLEASGNLDALTVKQMLELINDQDAAVAQVVRRAIPTLTKLIQQIVIAIRRGGRLIYLGAGTSGRLGVLDASECPPTFNCDPRTVVGVIAGGDKALRQSSEWAEDDPDGASEQFKTLNLNSADVVIGIAAGGTTPYVLGGLRLAKARGATTGLICCTATAAQADHVIQLHVGPEVLAGSTRMKAATATKLALNMITTTTMVQQGKAWGNLMVDLRAANAKLLDRSLRIISEQCDLPRDAAQDILIHADGRVKVALVMVKRCVGAPEAQHLLDQHDQQLRPIVGPPRYQEP